jgi:hypothetical protein
MANSLLTPTTILRKAGFLFHQKANFIGSITRDYDDRYANSGAKIGSTLKIRLPNRYSVTDGATLNVQDTEEASVDLAVTSRKHVGMKFDTNDLTLTIDDFSERYIEPAVAVLAAAVEADVMTQAYKATYNQVNNPTGALTFRNVMQAGKKLTDNLAPLGKRTANLNTMDKVDLVDANKGLFQDSKAIAEQYREGMLGRTGGFDFMENTLWPTHTTGTAAGSVTGAGTSSAYTMNGSQEGATLTVVPGSNAGTLTKGDIITISGVFRVHPESKVSTNELQQFAVTASIAASATSITITPTIVTSGGKQNVTAIALSDAVIYKVGTTSDVYGISMAYHKMAFAFATADLIMPRGVHFAAREVMDGLSMRLISDYNITNDQVATRLDILYGFCAPYPETACRIACN